MKRQKLTSTCVGWRRLFDVLRSKTSWSTLDNRRLVGSYISYENCERIIREEYLQKIKKKFSKDYMKAHDSKLGKYVQVNPTLKNPIYTDNVFELERILLTQYKTESNNLRSKQFVSGVLLY